MTHFFTIVAALLTGAHFLRTGSSGLVAASLLVLLPLLSRRCAALPILRLFLLLFTVLWGVVTFEMVSFRAGVGAPWLRLSTILGAVILVNVIALASSYRRRFTRRFTDAPQAESMSLFAFVLTAILLVLVQLKAPSGMLLMQRFIRGGGWFELIVLAFYAAFLVEKMSDVTEAPRWRQRAFRLFALVFFFQLTLGLMGADKFLMTGRLHPPVPAVILAGPLFRGDGFFMLILFGVTLLLVGPSWCSHLCYIGAFDQWAAGSRRRPTRLPGWARYLRFALLAAVLGSALVLRCFGVAPLTAGLLAVGFGAVGVVLMMLWSRRTGVMTHCTVFCPLGMVADIGGRINPFRIHIERDCNGCGRCSAACRYDALSKQNIAKRTPGRTCSLCGDCLASCREGHIVYRFGSLRGPTVRATFLVLVVTLHAVFLGVARI